MGDAFLIAPSILELDMEVMQQIYDAEDATIANLARVAGLDPAKDFRFADLSGVDWRGTDVSRYDLTGAILGPRYDGFLVTPTGIELRRSAGAAGYRMMLAAMVYEFGWIDVELTDHVATVQVDGSQVSDNVLEVLWPELEERAPNRRIVISRMSRDQRAVAVAFTDIQSARRYLESSVKALRVKGDIREIKDPEALPATESIDLAAPRDDDHILRALFGAEWLALPDTSDFLKMGRLKERKPEIVSFVLSSLGWVGLKRRRQLQQEPLGATPPQLIALDPSVVRTEILTRLLALCESWAGTSVKIRLAWWDGSTWMQEFGTAEQIADRVSWLCGQIR